MQNTALENGFTMLPNALLMRLMRTPISGLQMRILLTVVRYTCGFRRDSAALSVGFLAQMTGGSHNGVARAVRDLMANGILVAVQSDGTAAARTLALADFAVPKTDAATEKTSADSEKEYIPKGIQGVSQTEYSGISQTGYQERKNRNKSLKTRFCAPACERTNPQFETFWNAYPKKRDREKAERAFARLQPDAQLSARMLTALDRQRASPEWQREAGRFIPNPAKWLADRRFEETLLQPAAYPTMQTMHPTNGAAYDLGLFEQMLNA